MRRRAGSGSPPRAARTLAHQASVTLGRPSAPNPRTLSRQASLPDDWRLDGGCAAPHALPHLHAVPGMALVRAACTQHSSCVPPSLNSRQAYKHAITAHLRRACLPAHAADARGQPRRVAALLPGQPWGGAPRRLQDAARHQVQVQLVRDRCCQRCVRQHQSPHCSLRLHVRNTWGGAAVTKQGRRSCSSAVPTTAKPDTHPFSLPHAHTASLAHELTRRLSQTTQRWDKMGSSALNEKPDEEPSDDHKGYVPQFGVTGQEMHYHMEQEVEAHGALQKHASACILLLLRAYNALLPAAHCCYCECCIGTGQLLLLLKYCRRALPGRRRRFRHTACPRSLSLRVPPRFHILTHHRR